MKEVTLVLGSKEGLHARPAGIFAKAAAGVKSSVKIYKNGNNKTLFNAKSIISVLSMGAVNGDHLTLVLEGEDEEAAIVELKELLESDLDA